MPQTIWARVETPPPHLGNAQIDPAFFLSGASLSVLIDFTDVTLVSDDTYRKLSDVIMMTLMKVI